jgi:hypothetical protein
MNTQCTIAPGRPSKTGGYARKTVNGVPWYAHRLAWVQAFGPVPDGLMVCHTCDVRMCINIEHLFLGTHADNMADMVKKGRSKKLDTPQHFTLRLAKDDHQELARLSKVQNRPIAEIVREAIQIYTKG